MSDTVKGTVCLDNESEWLVVLFHCLATGFLMLNLIENWILQNTRDFCYSEILPKRTALADPEKGKHQEHEYVMHRLANIEGISVLGWFV